MTDNTHTDNEEHKSLHNKVSEIIRWNGFNLSNDEAVKELVDYIQANYTPKPTKSSGELEEIIDKLAEVADGYGTGPNWQFFVNTAKIEARSWHATQTTKLQAEARLDEHDTTINYHYPAEESADYKRGFKAATGQVEQWSARRGQELKAELAQLEREHKIGEDGE